MSIAVVPSGWKNRTFDELVAGRVKRRPTIPKSSYATTGTYPVIDQGAGRVAGWTNDAGCVHEDVPLIVFGDHTRTVKFVDRPFACGADGTQLIRADVAVVDPLFLYFLLLATELSPRGYARHYGLLKERQFALPDSLSEQCAIAAVLAKLQRYAQVQQQNIEQLETLLFAMMAKLFKEGTHCEAPKATEAGLIPESWAVVELGKIAALGSRGTPSRKRSEYWGGEVPWVTTTSVNYQTIMAADEYLTPLGLRPCAATVLDPGTILLAMYGQGATRGRAARLGISAATNQACAAVHSTGAVDQGYLYWALVRDYERLRARSHGANQQNLSLTLLRAHRLPLPSSLEEQREIAGMCDAIAKRVANARTKLKFCEQLFSTTLQALLTPTLRLPQHLWTPTP